MESHELLLGGAEEVTVADLPRTLGAPQEGHEGSARPEPDFGTTVLPLREMQRRYVVWALQKLGGRKLLTAETLGIDDKTLAKWLSQP